MAKRRIEKRIVYIYQQLDNVTTATDLLSGNATERRTLIRTVGNLHFVRDNAPGTFESVESRIELLPQLTTVVPDLAPGTTHQYEDGDSYYILWGSAFGVYERGDGLYIEIDVKSKRILEEDDKVQLKFKSTEAANWAPVHGCLTMFYIVD